MTARQSDDESLIINGAAVDRGVLEARPIRRCRIEECQAHCCGGGVALSVQQAEDILAHADLIVPHLPPDRRDPQTWFDWALEPETDHPAGGVLTNTTVVEDSTHPMGTNCIFLRPDRKCALQTAGIAAGEHPWRWKPFYCALHPITFDECVVGLAEHNELYLEGGSCSRPEPGALIPIYKLFEAEMRLALGDEGYAELEARAGGSV
jgi:hypothetical protein